ncbi:ABC transporter substrate-binding protein [Streptomyces pluripotens]|uniref:ABC transporter substrate-binding protein n=1 Tax=Streptomyces pluripotens TaxID=1355015 RepID=A0A221NT12_9ACTN|nr:MULTISPECIES: extracellular solute-binding protein [Streptomyces]ARP68880.1 ABC transporter substrate-binding protein [Streptomyces pluripotens]ASN23133.1 ABC transporter substrate-binding protein [Streptomyces pluripotens]KIE25847.1 ABC transporter substrate-binding protein [Streptomyces sp. MUSC 125]MCH0556863.1 extracellular solute-binding protein [Streptomyces sp. MUM 16J]
MSMSRRTLTAAVFALVLPLSACGSGGDGGGSADASGKVEGDITFQTWNLRANFKPYFEGLIAGFEKKHPGTHVKWIDQPAEGYPDKLSADAAGGTLPDVVNVSPDLVAPLAEAGLALDLDKVAPQYKSDYLPGAWASHQIPGKRGTYAFPWYLNTGPLFYNKALFRKAGLDPDRPPKTYDELFADALRMAKESGGSVATLANVPTIEDFGRYGVPLMNQQGTAFSFNDAKGVELLTKYKELYDAKALDPQALTATPESSGKKFLTGAVAMNPGSALDLGNFKKNAPSLYRNIGITDQITSTGHVNMYVMGVMVNSRTKHTAAAVAFAHFVTDAQNQMSFAKKVAIFPSTAHSLADPYFSKEDGTDETRVRVAAAKSLKNAVNYTPVLFSDQMKTALRNEVAKALQGKESPKAALDNAVSTANRLLKQG